MTRPTAEVQALAIHSTSSLQDAASRLETTLLPRLSLIASSTKLLKMSNTNVSVIIFCKLSVMPPERAHNTETSVRATECHREVEIRRRMVITKKHNGVCLSSSKQEIICLTGKDNSVYNLAINILLTLPYSKRLGWSGAGYFKILSLFKLYSLSGMFLGSSQYLVPIPGAMRISGVNQDDGLESHRKGNKCICIVLSISTTV